MKVTRIAMLEMNDHESKALLDRLLEVFSSAIRFSFNRLIEGHCTLEVMLPKKVI